jgi:hypothetical protein
LSAMLQKINGKVGKKAIAVKGWPYLWKNKSFKKYLYGIYF